MATDDGMDKSLWESNWDYSNCRSVGRRSWYWVFCRKRKEKVNELRKKFAAMKSDAVFAFRIEKMRFGNCNQCSGTTGQKSRRAKILSNCTNADQCNNARTSETISCNIINEEGRLKI